MTLMKISILYAVSITALISQFSHYGYGQEFVCEENESYTDEGQKDRRKEHGNLDYSVRDSNTNFRDRKEIILSDKAKGLDTNRKKINGSSKLLINKKTFVLFGTKWCGDGNKAETNDTLGMFSKVDSCCREHDFCHDFILSGKTKYELINNYWTTRSHCDCDSKFYNCLKSFRKISIARAIGYIYFTQLGPQCFKEDYPIVDCMKREKNRCILYKQNVCQKKKYQWFDNPTF